jgi:hypothetical protein
MIGAGRDNEAKRRQNIGSSLMDGRTKTEVHAHIWCVILDNTFTGRIC